jgi:hypothetical protein
LEEVSLRSSVSLHFDGLPLGKAARVLEHAFPGRVGLPLSTYRKKTVSVRVENKPLKSALEEAGFWVK